MGGGRRGVGAFMCVMCVSEYVRGCPLLLYSSFVFRIVLTIQTWNTDNIQSHTQKPLSESTYGLRHTNQGIQGGKFYHIKLRYPRWESISYKLVYPRWDIYHINQGSQGGKFYHINQGIQGGKFYHINQGIQGGKFYHIIRVSKVGNFII